MRGISIVVCLVLGLGLGAVPATASEDRRAPDPARASSGVRAGEPARIELRLRAAVRRLDVRRERRAGYDRDKFEHWVDADGDCYDTRDEVLRAESRRRARGPSCDIARGRWFSYYDRRFWRSDDDVDIDHLVPLAEAWDSGAKGWNPATRRRFANDLRDRRSLVAVTDDVNQSKGDQDVAEWLPAHGRCRYVREWVAVKLRWSLRVNRAEKRVLRDRAGDCRNRIIKVRRARIGR